MAIYQFVIELLPSKWIKENKDTAINLLSKGDEYGTSIAWEKYDLKDSIDAIVSKILPIGKSWHKDLKIWGDEEHDDIQVWLDQEKIESIRIRLDLRNNNDEIKLKCVDLANQLNCSFFIPSTNKIVKANIRDLNNMILNSKAAKFINDPEKFLDGTKK